MDFVNRRAKLRELDAAERRGCLLIVAGSSTRIMNALSLNR
jgi:hypothetical protein